MSIKEECKVDRVKNLNFNLLKPNRAGAIVYTIHKGRVYFIGGIDTKSGEFTDFAGGISYKTDSNALSGGLREFMEESLGIFGDISVEEIGECITVYDQSNLIIFLPLKMNINAIYTEFINRLRYFPQPEVKDLIFLNKRQFISLIDGDEVNGTIMYDKVRNLLSEGRRNNFMRYL